MHSQERLHHLLRFTPTPPAAIADQQQQSGEYAEAIRAERFYYQSMASQYMKDYWIHFFTPTIWQKKKNVTSGINTVTVKPTSGLNIEWWWRTKSKKSHIFSGENAKAEHFYVQSVVTGLTPNRWWNFKSCFMVDGGSRWQRCLEGTLFTSSWKIATLFQIYTTMNRYPSVPIQ